MSKTKIHPLAQMEIDRLQKLRKELDEVKQIMKEDKRYCWVREKIRLQTLIEITERNAKLFAQ